MAWHDIGHGADAVSYWQWRSALNGQEQYHGTLVGADGTPVPLYPEVAQIGAEFAKAGPALAGTTVQSDVAILHAYDSPLGHQLPAPQQGLTTRRRAHQLLRAAPRPSPSRSTSSAPAPP